VIQIHDSSNSPCPSYCGLRTTAVLRFRAAHRSMGALCSE
jgi:hypothetical protein